jgi:hypothetical protein
VIRLHDHCGVGGSGVLSHDHADPGLERVPGARGPHPRPGGHQPPDDRIPAKVMVGSLGVRVEAEDPARPPHHVDQARPVRQVRAQHEVLRTFRGQLDDPGVVVDQHGPAVADGRHVLDAGDRAGAQHAEHRVPRERGLERHPEREAAVGHQPVLDPATGPQLTGGSPEHFLAGAVELADAAEPGGEGQLGDRQVGVVEQTAGEMHPGGAGELVRGQAQVLAEQPSELPSGQAQASAEILLGAVVQGPIQNEPHGAADHFRAEPGRGGFPPVWAAMQAGPEARGLSRRRQREPEDVAGIRLGPVRCQAVETSGDDSFDVGHVYDHGRSA